MVPWLLRFARRCNERDHARGRVALAALGERSVELLEEMADDGVAARLYRMPLLLAAREPEHARTFLARLGPLKSFGFRIPSELLGPEAIRAREPALSSAVRAGFVLEQHCVVEPAALLAALRDRLVELGVEISEGSDVRDIAVDGSRLRALRTSSGTYRCERAVLAAGSWLGPLGRVSGLRLPVQGGKGYTFEVRPRNMPAHALLLLEPHVGCSPLGDRLRIAGTMEFSGINGRLDRRRLGSIVAGSREMLGDLPEPDEDSLWCGLRPIAPDGLPIVDRHPHLDNVFIAGAYSMLGMTLAAPAAQSLARFVLTGTRPAELEPFRATRFGRGSAVGN
jgi:D-amino-acid dehydrogenase